MTNRKQPDPSAEERSDDDTDKTGDADEEAGLVDRVRQIVEDVLPDLLGERTKGSAKAEAPAKPRTAAGQEEDAEAKVRAALAKIEHEKEHETLRRQRQEPERPPSTVRRITKVMWGE